MPEWKPEIRNRLADLKLEPTREAERIRDYIAFFNERVDIEVDGELQERPVTQWSKSPRPHAATPHS